MHLHKTKLYGTLALALLVGAAGCDRPEQAEQDEQAPASLDQALMPQEMDPEMMEHIMEIQEIQQRLQPLQQQALQDEALAGQLEVLQARIETAMQTENAALFDRIDSFQVEMAAAEAAGDQEQMQALMTEAQGLQQDIQELQAEVLERPDIRGPVEEFEAAHRARMIEIDPEAESLLDRVEELMASLPR